MGRTSLTKAKTVVVAAADETLPDLEPSANFAGSPDQHFAQVGRSEAGASGPAAGADNPAEGLARRRNRWRP